MFGAPAGVGTAARKKAAAKIVRERTRNRRELALNIIGDCSLDRDSGGTGILAMQRNLLLYHDRFSRNSTKAAVRHTAECRRSCSKAILPGYQSELSP